MHNLEDTLTKFKIAKRHENRIQAYCPAHEDKNPSLAVRLLDDGRILLHCFSGCSTEEVLSAVDMSLTDLFPEPLTHGEPMRPMKPAFFSSDLMRIVHFEALVVLITALDIDKGRMPSEETRRRVRIAYERIDEAVRYANAG